MNIALWPATLGYWMETHDAAGVHADAPSSRRASSSSLRRRRRRDAGDPHRLAALRHPAGDGVVAHGVARSARHPRPTISRTIPCGRFCARLYPMLRGHRAGLSRHARDVSFVGKPGDPHAMLLDIVGLHPGSVEWSQRYAESLQTLFNRLNLLGLGGLLRRSSSRRASAQHALDLLTQARLRRRGDPPILDQIFSGKHNALKGGVVDDRPLSETDRIRAYTTAGEQLHPVAHRRRQHVARRALRQEGFTTTSRRRRSSILLLRHALQLGYHDVSIRLHETRALHAGQAVRGANRRSVPARRATDAVSESRYQPLYAVAPQITGDAAPDRSHSSSRATSTLLDFALPARPARGARAA